MDIRPTILFELPNRRSFLAAYFHQGALGGVFVPGQLLLDPGAEVQLDIIFVEEDRTFRTRGVVRWRRAQRARNLEPGLGIEFLPSEETTRDLLIEFANGRNVRVVNQRARRLPVKLEVQYATQSVFLTDVTDDISEGGLFILTDDLLPVGTEVRLKLKSPGRMFAIKIRGEVAWCQQEGRRGFGVRFIFDKPSTEKKIRELVDNIREKVAQDLEFRVPLGRARFPS